MKTTKNCLNDMLSFILKCNIAMLTSFDLEYHSALYHSKHTHQNKLNFEEKARRVSLKFKNLSLLNSTFNVRVDTDSSNDTDIWYFISQRIAQSNSNLYHLIFSVFSFVDPCFSTDWNGICWVVGLRFPRAVLFRGRHD